MSSLNYTDVFCYICRGILIEPVTLPCSHVFCLSCFEQSMQETSYSCPLCRKRISNWVRSVKKSNKLVNSDLWTKIREQFKDQVRLKLNGEDDGLDQRLQEDYTTYVSTSKPGELAQEFSKFFNDFRKELEKIKEAEELASKEYIMKLQEEEKQEIELLAEDNVTRIEEDAILAKKIQEEINKDISASIINENSQKSSKKIKKTNKKNTGSLKGPMDEFIKGYLNMENLKENDASVLEEPEERSKSTDSTDSIRLEMNLFKPIKKVRKTPPKQYPDGRVREINLTKVTPLKLTFSNLGPSSSSASIVEGKKIHSKHSAFVDTNTMSQETKDEYSCPSKRLRCILDSSESTVLKDITLGENADSNPGMPVQDETINKKVGVLKKASQLLRFDVEEVEETTESLKNQDFEYTESRLAEKIIEEQRRIERIILQEKEDRDLALKLSREWEMQAKERPQTRSMQAKNKPQTRSMRPNVKSTKTVSNKLQQTLMDSMSGLAKNRKK